MCSVTWQAPNKQSAWNVEEFLETYQLDQTWAKSNSQQPGSNKIRPCVIFKNSYINHSRPWLGAAFLN